MNRTKKNTSSNTFQGDPAMTRIVSILILLLAVSVYSDARIRWVDKKGGLDPLGFQKYTTIQTAIDVSMDGDTVRVSPGLYPERVKINKYIVVQGGGLNTMISAMDITASGGAVEMTAGKLMWFVISSSWDGLWIQNATATNCVIVSCIYCGVVTTASGGIVSNCVSANNNEGFFVNPNTAMTAVNCIAINNRDCGFGVYTMYGGSGVLMAKFCNSFGNTNYNYCNRWVGSPSPGALVRTSCVEVDPGFGGDAQYRSMIKDTGDSGLLDLDGSTSDVGYYGGPDAPLLPYVELPANIKLNADGTIQFDMTGKVGY
jgi:hypothetical protein